MVVVVVLVVGNMQSAHSPLLRMVAEDGVFTVVRWLFSRLPDALELPMAAVTALAVPPVLAATAATQAPRANTRGAPQNGVLDSFVQEAQQPTAIVAATAGQDAGNANASTTSGQQTRGGTDSREFSPDQQRRAGRGAGAGGCGLPCVVKVFGFLCSQLVRRGGGGGTGVGGGGGGGGGTGGSSPIPRRVLCLRLMRTALAAAGPTLALYPPLLEMVRDDLFFAILHLVQGR